MSGREITKMRERQSESQRRLGNLRNRKWTDYKRPIEEGAFGLAWAFHEKSQVRLVQFKRHFLVVVAKSGVTRKPLVPQTIWSSSHISCQSDISLGYQRFEWNAFYNLTFREAYFLIFI